MARLWLLTIASALLALLFYAGCNSGGLEQLGDGGGAQDCRQLDEKSCLAAGSACVADYCYACACTPSFTVCRRPSDAQTTCPLYGCPRPLCECNGLSENDCLSAQPSLGCSPSYCYCSGNKFFGGCADPGGDAICPLSCPVETCHDRQDCQNGWFCRAPGESAGCGVCRPATDCSDDSMCAAGEICAFDLCVCNYSGNGCFPGCAQSGCAEGQTCGNNNHCIPTFCQKPSDCPAQFDCSANQCQRKACSSDSMCPNGYCVKDYCYASFGVCTAPVP
jgi:hypothetical protein